jgi:hypothetical protein
VGLERHLHVVEQKRHALQTLMTERHTTLVLLCLSLVYFSLQRPQHGAHSHPAQREDLTLFAGYVCDQVEQVYYDHHHHHLRSQSWPPPSSPSSSSPLQADVSHLEFLRQHIQHVESLCGQALLRLALQPRHQQLTPPRQARAHDRERKRSDQADQGLGSPNPDPPSDRHLWLGLVPTLSTPLS